MADHRATEEEIQALTLHEMLEKILREVLAVSGMHCLIEHASTIDTPEQTALFTGKPF